MPGDKAAPVSTIYHPRLFAYRHLIATLGASGAAGTEGGSIWLDFLNRLPVTLGESAANRSVRFSVSDRVHHTIVRGIDGLVDLVKRRADAEYDREKKKALLPDERMRAILWPKRFCPRTISEESPLRAVVAQSLAETPDLDAGVLESWLCRTGGGEPLFNLLVSSASRALAMSREQPAYSGISLMTHLALLNTLLDVKGRVKQASVKNMSYARLERTVGMAIHACFSRAMRDAQASVMPSVGSAMYADSLVVLTSLSPAQFVFIRQDELATDINPFGLSREIVAALGPAYQATLERGNDPVHLLSGCLIAVYGQKTVFDLLMPLAVCEAFRRLALDHLLACEDSDSECDRLLGRSFPSNDAILSVLSDADLLSEIARQLEQRIEDGRHTGKMLPRTRRLLLAVERLRKDGSPGAHSDRNSVYLQEMVERFLLYRLDEFAMSHFGQARRRVVDRRTQAGTSQLIQEYEAGKLYRIADDDMPLIKARVVSDQGQLFVDLKGYTRRTAKAKELVMADFLKKEFYEPILEAGRKYCQGGSMLPEEDNIRLVNLLGDAVAFSGNIVSLVKLARDIQNIFRDYRRKIEQQAPLEEQDAYRVISRRVEDQRSGVLAELENLSSELACAKQEVFRRSALDASEKVRQLQKDFENRFADAANRHRVCKTRLDAEKDPSERKKLLAERDQLRQAHNSIKEQRRQITQELKAQSGDALSRRLTDLLCQNHLKQIRQTEDRLLVLKQEDRALEEALEQERRIHLGAELEAGLFISYGVAPEVISIEDDVWGTQRVSISERINEAARGTARNAAVLSALQEAMAGVRLDRSNPRLELPYRVFISETGALSLEPSAHRLWGKAIEEHDRGQLDEFIAILRKQFEQAGDRQTAGHAKAGSDIYNLGEALSAGALDAYLRQTRHTHFFFRLQVRTGELHPELRDRFFFPEEVSSLVVGRRMGDQVPIEEVEIFRYVGQILFRGFEVTRPTSVYEILRQRSPFLQLLIRHHLPAWLKEASANPDCKIENLID
ncbi:MAG TPA: hypothetical protein VM425_21545 [Myxococcota bacterium]|nr:hypothetical protein [Myxococcota bacterium]